MMKNFCLFTFLVFTSVLSTLSPVMAQDDLVYVPVDPCRVVDTRSGGGAISANTFRNFLVSGTMGELAVQGGQTDCLDPKAGTGEKPLAISAYVVAVPANGSSNGVLTAYPSHLLPPPVGAGSTVNFAAGQIIGNTTNITLCDQVTCPTDGEFAVLARNTNQHVVIDVQGYFYPATPVKRLAAVDANGGDIAFASTPGRLGTVDIVSPTGYYSSMYPGKGRLARYTTLYFTDTTCGGNGGTAWIDYSSSFAFIPGTVFDNNNYEVAGSSDTWPTNDLWYLPKSATLANNLLVGSSKTSFPGSPCNTAALNLLEAAEVFANDPAITGIANTPYPAPITLEYH